MNGLGIVLEEARTDPTPSVDSKHTANEVTEVLLPPLPSEATPTADGASDSDGCVSPISSTSDELPQSNDMQFFSNSNSSFSTYELNSPSINLENNQLFPSMSDSNSVAGKDSAPLKRLKSIKQTIRKLSLSKNGEPKPDTSIRKTSAAQSLASQMYAFEPRPPLEIRPHVNPIQSHIKNPSNDSNESYKFKCITPTTPPLSSPIITLTENLTFDNIEKNLQNIQQAFLDNYKITAEELDNHLGQYHGYLSNEKTLIEDSFTATKNRLTKSGWCSSEDLEKLQKQKVNVLAKIEQALDEVERRLAE